MLVIDTIPKWRFIRAVMKGIVTPNSVASFVLLEQTLSTLCKAKAEMD